MLTDGNECGLTEEPSQLEESDKKRLPDVVVESKMHAAVLDHADDHPETYLSIAIQVFIPFLIAGLGMVGAGLVLDVVQHWVVFEEITEIVILVPALLGLKGNLEMTLASRLSTQANLGHMDTTKQQWSMIVGNLTLIQCQANVVGFLASVVAIVMGSIKSRSMELDHAYLLCASSLVTASLASFVLGLITAAVIVFSRHCNINPDNVATPIAASLGDITSLALLSWISTILYDAIGKKDWLAPLIISCYILVTPLWVWIAKKNKHTNEVLYTGWTPVLAAMFISSVGGLILDSMVSRFEGIAVFQPVINGVGGNLVAVQASRISTQLHQDAQLGTLADENADVFITPKAGFFGKNNPQPSHARALANISDDHNRDCNDNVTNNSSNNNYYASSSNNVTNSSSDNTYASTSNNYASSNNYTSNSNNDTYRSQTNYYDYKQESTGKARDLKRSSFNKSRHDSKYKSKRLKIEPKQESKSKQNPKYEMKQDSKHETSKTPHLMKLPIPIEIINETKDCIHGLEKPIRHKRRRHSTPTSTSNLEWNMEVWKFLEANVEAAKRTNSYLAKNKK